MIHDIINVIVQVVRHGMGQVRFKDHTEHRGTSGYVLAQGSRFTTLGEIFKGQVVGANVPMKFANRLFVRGSDEK